MTFSESFSVPLKQALQIGVSGIAVFSVWAALMPSAVALQLEPANEVSLDSGAIAVGASRQSAMIFQKGIEKALEGDYQGAIVIYNRVLQLNPSGSDVYYNRGVAHFAIGESNKAIHDFDRAIELNPDLAAAYGNRGTILLQRGDRTGALADFRKATAIFLEQGDTNSAAQMQQVIRRLAPSS